MNDASMSTPQSSICSKPDVKNIPEFHELYDQLRAESKNLVEFETPIPNPVPPADKNIQEAKRIISIFKESLNNAPTHYFSYDSAVVLLSFIALDEKKCQINNLSKEDIDLINKSVPVGYFISTFEIGLNKNKDFVLKFTHTRNPEDVKTITFINPVSTPKSGDIPSCTDISVDDGTLKVGHFKLNRDSIRNRANCGKEKSTNVESNVEPNLDDVQKQIINTTNKNAYEIRADVLGMALDWIKHKHIPNAILVDPKINEDRILEVAKAFYKFVENKR